MFKQLFYSFAGSLAWMVQELQTSWGKFSQAFQKALNYNLDNSQQKTLRYILDNSNTGYISASKFNEFLKGFGPFQRCMHNLNLVIQEPWFHGFLTSNETHRFLETEPDSTFLVRFSSSNPGSFALTFKNNGIVTSTLIKTTEQGYFFYKFVKLSSFLNQNRYEVKNLINLISISTSIASQSTRVRHRSFIHQ